MDNGIHLDLPEEEYNADTGSISKTGLWTLINRTPAHYRYAPIRARKPALDKGSAVHLCILEPNLAAERVILGPKDRRGNKWKEAIEAAPDNAYVLPQGDYDDVMSMAEVVRQHPIIKKLNSTTIMYESSAFWTDEKTGLQVRCRPDAFAPDVAIMADLKSTGDASHWNWSRTAANMGYHVQEAAYTEGWGLAGGDPVDAFVFICVETDAPFCTVVYEMDPAAVAEGSAVFHLALQRYKECLGKDEWPGYSTSVVPIDIPSYSYRETDSPQVTS